MTTPYAARRTRVLQQLGPNAALIVAAAPELSVGADGELRYQPDPDLYYLTGMREPGTVAVLCPSADKPFTLFVQPRDVERERWDGPRLGVDGAVGAVGADAAHPLAELHANLPKLVAGVTTLYAPLETQRPDVDAAIRAALAHGRQVRPRSGRGPHTVTDASAVLAPMRVRKEPIEIDAIRAAARITVAAFSDAAAMLARAEGEWEVEAALEYGMRRRGATASAFPAIVAGGPRAATLHYRNNDMPLQRDELLLIDAGARWQMYCADVSRTFPIAASFTSAQRDVYDVVLRTHVACIAAVVPGAPAQVIDDVALRVLSEGMRELGLLRESLDEIIEQKLYRRYYPHRTSHWLGLDVHDVGDYALADGTPVTLEESMVLTIEPGLYIPLSDADAPAALRGIAVRLEDDLLVTVDGNEVLTEALPRARAAIEAMIG